MPRFVRRALAGSVLLLIGCSVYDASLLVGGASSSGTGADGSGASGGSRGGSGGGSGGGSLGGSGGVGGSSSGDAGKPSTGGTKSGGSGGAGGAGGSGGAGGAGGSNGGSVSKGGSGGAGATGGDAVGGADDSGGGMGAEAGMGNPGQGGTGSPAGAGGTGGSGGSGGAGAGAGGTTSGAGSGGTGGAPTTASGCAVLSASLAANTDKTHYLITLGTTDVDFSSAVISVHLYAAGTGGGVFLYVQEATYEFFGMPPHAISTINGWTTLSWDLSAETATTPLDKTKVRRLGLEIDGTGSTAWTNPTLVYIDSITVTSPTLAFSFDATSSVYKTPTSSYSTDTALWLNSDSNDTTAAGSTVDWAASCP